MILRNTLLFLLAFTLALGFTTWGSYWKVKMTGTESLCAARFAYCVRDSENDDFMRSVERVSGCCAPPNGTLWCSCVWSNSDSNSQWGPP